MPTILLAPGALALAAALAAGPASPPAARLSSSQRASAQTRFAEAYVKAHPAARPLATPADLDRFLGQLQAAWAQSLGSSPPDPALARLDSSVPLYAMLALTAHKPPDWARCYVWSHHALPALYADLDTMRSGPSAEHAGLIGGLALVHVLGYPMFDCRLPQAEWDRFRAAMDELPRLTDTYLERRAYADEAAARELRHLHDVARDQRPVLAVLDALRHDDLARARRELAQGFAQGARFFGNLAEAGRMLADAHRARGQTGEALSVLDLIARSTRVSDVSAEDLRGWYAAADPRGGPERYARAAAARLPVLVPAGERVQLAGRYVELATGRPLDLASLAGKTVLLDFWATWCTICLAEIPRLNAIAERYAGDGLVVVGVSSDALTGRKAPEPAVRDMARQKGIRYPVVYDPAQGSLTERFGVAAWPTRILIGADGRRLAAPGPIQHDLILEEIETYLAAAWGPRPAPGSPPRP